MIPFINPEQLSHRDRKQIGDFQGTGECAMGSDWVGDRVFLGMIKMSLNDGGITS